ncbi:dimethylamine monooxygenase subunit DmmA family protein [Prauserella flavalba]|uniref:dimethylamine monooxygenase subunit DmmA family protein n=1 Tax=Prauserella flavalba TaxID=1477506 RepID=UPI0011B6DF40|nr:dimethylamine monooxygenase subunit DmmA family protein [Prauserella flavalba]
MDPGVDHAGTSFAVMSFSAEGRAVARRWAAALTATGAPVWAWHGDGATERALAELRDRLDGATVGWRLMLAGPEADVLRARSLAVERDAIDAEIRVHVCGTGRKRVWCAHCGGTTETECEAGQAVACANCGRGLLVHDHVSRRHAAYLGVLADPET